MKGLLKHFLVFATAIPLLTSCLSDNGNSQAGFVNLQRDTTVFANTAQGYLYFMSYGNWQLSYDTSAGWYTPSMTSGKAMTINYIPVAYKMNTTGSLRTLRVSLIDSDNPGDAYVNFYVGQHSTRSDGSLGNAPLVQSIKGDDGTEISVDYDSHCRPLRVCMVKGENTYRNMSFAWSDSMLTVTAINSTLHGSISSTYQPNSLISSTDTVGLFSRNINSLFNSEDQMFNFEEHINSSSEYIVQALLYEKQSLVDPDGDRHIDSLRYVHHYSNGSEVRGFMKLSYGDDKQSNCHQSVDANQLLLGVEECNPYLLVGLFRNVRSTRLISEASTSTGSYNMEATRNSDNSINTLTVTDKNGQKITYTFSYYPNSLWQ